MSELSFFSTVGREVLWTLAEGLFAAVIIVLLVPVLIKGDWVQCLLAVVVLPLPVLALWDACSRMS